MRRWLEIQIFFRQPVLNTESKECGFLGACFRCHKINLRRSGVIHRVKRVFSCFSVAMSRLTKHIWKYPSGYKRKEIFHSLRPVHVVVAQLEPWHSNRSEALPQTLVMSKKTKYQDSTMCFNVTSEASQTSWSEHASAVTQLGSGLYLTTEIWSPNTQNMC